MFFHLGRIVTRYRWLIVGLWMVAIAIALPFAPQATQVLHSGGFVSPDFESERAITLLAQKLHFDPTIVQVIFTSRRYSADSPVPVFVLLVTLGLPFLSVRFSAPDASILPADVPSRAAFDLLARRFNDRETTPVLIAVQTQGDVLSPHNIRTLYAYVQRIQADPRVARVDSIVSADPRFTLDQYELLYTHPQLIADPYLSAVVQTTVAGNTLEMLVISKYGMLDSRSQALVQAIRNTNPGGGISILADGGTAGGIDYVNSLYTDFPKAILIVALITYVLLLFLFRSLVLPLKAILMNTLSILASYGALVVIFQNGFLHQVHGFTPLGFVEASSPILLFFALFGLSMDYEVFLLSRVQEAFW